jgi:hypothetical protein
MYELIYTDPNKVEWDPLRFFWRKSGKIIKASGEIKDQEEKDRGIHLFASLHFLLYLN